MSHELCCDFSDGGAASDGILFAVLLHECRKKNFLKIGISCLAINYFIIDCFFFFFPQGTPGGCQSCIIPNHIDSCLNSQTKNQTNLKYLPSNFDGLHLVYIIAD